MTEISGPRNRVLCPVALLVWACLLSSSLAYGQEETESRRDPKINIAESFGNWIAVGSGQVRDGERIPLPRYRDGKQALRSEVQYMVSPGEIPTSLTYIKAGGAFYVRCTADGDGYVHISLWQQAGTGEGIRVVGRETYEQLKDHFATPGVTSPGGSENITVAQMRVLSERLVANYLVIALRSSKK